MVRRRLFVAPLAATLVAGLLAMIPGTPAALAKSSPPRLVKQTETADIYANGDDTNTAVFYAGPTNFFDKATNRWRKIDSQLLEVGGRIENAAGPIQVRLPSNLSAADGVTVGKDGDWSASLTFVDATSKRAARINDGKVRYDQVAPGVSLEYRMLSYGLKGDIILVQPLPATHAGRFRFQLSVSGAAPVAVDGGTAVALQDAQGHEVARIPRGTMTDASGADGVVDMRLSQAGGAWLVDVVPDPAFLRSAERTYPIKVDPSLASFGSDTYANSLCGSCNYNGWDSLKAGRMGTSEYYSYVRFPDVTAILGKAVTAATLHVVKHYSDDPSNYGLTALRTNGAWDANTLNWSNKAAHGSEQFHIGLNQDIYDFPITSWAQGWANGVDGEWINGQWSPYGATINTAGDWAYYELYSYEHGVNRPELWITYTNQSPRVPPATSLSPADGWTGTSTPALTAALDDPDDRDGWIEFDLDNANTAIVPTENGAVRYTPTWGSGTHSWRARGRDRDSAGPWTALRYLTIQNFEPVGVVERAGSQISGWVHDPNDANQRLTVKIYLDGALAQTVTANVSRPNNNPPANDGFQWTVPAQYLDGKDHLLKVEALDYPSNTPIRITDTTMSFLELDDAWTGTNGALWNSSAWNTSSLSVDRVVDISSNQGRLYVAGPAKDAQAKQVVTSNNAAIDSEALLSYQLVDPGDKAKLKVALRGSDSLTGSWMSHGYQAEIRSYSNVVKIYRVAAGIRSEIGGFTYTPGTAWQTMRMRVTGTNPVTINLKMWPKGTQEPDQWTKTVTDSDVTRVTTPGVFHVSLTNSGGTTARTAMVDDLGYMRLQTAINEGNPSSAPTNSFSIYIDGGPGTNFTSLGQQEGERVKNPTCSPAPTPCSPPPAPYDPLVILHFAAQKDDLNGVSGFDPDFVGPKNLTEQQVIDGSVAFINGYYGTNPGHELVFGLGTNNSHMRSCGSEAANEDCARKKGADWAGVVNSVWNAVKTAHPNVTVIGAQDFEEGGDFGGPAPQGPRNAKAWVAGFHSAANGRVFINFGAADGCHSATGSGPQGYAVNRRCETGEHKGSQAWTLDDYWFLSWGVPSAAGALPEIYNLSNNWKSDDWRNVSWYGYDSHDRRNILARDSRINFLGVLTQNTACGQPGRGGANCADALPKDAWANFRQRLDSQDPSTGQYRTKGEPLGFTSDIKWQTCEASRLPPFGGGQVSSSKRWRTTGRNKAN